MNKRIRKKKRKQAMQAAWDRPGLSFEVIDPGPPKEEEQSWAGWGAALDRQQERCPFCR